jgi:L-proline 3-hydroxylase-like protein/aspartyl/asparaginyl beta-hydroxylase
MESRIIGRLDLDAAQTRRDVDRILASPATSTYSGYSFGTWNIFVLWNASGNASDSTIREFAGSGRFTDLGLQTTYIASVIESNFRTDRMKWVRAFLLKRGNVVPHRDYLEFKKPLARIHLALFTDDSSMHSEDDEVFRMRSGEIWYLAAEKVHSAATLTDFPRTVICMEFDLPCGQGPEAMFLRRSECAPLPPCIVQREPLMASELEAIYQLGNIINEQNYGDVVGLLSKVHFYKRTPAGDLFDWMIEITRRSGKVGLIERATDFKRNCIERRRMNEHISVH